MLAAVLLAEVWNNPPTPLHPIHIFVVRLLHWGKLHWLTAAAIGVIAAIISAAIAFRSLQLTKQQATSNTKDKSFVYRRKLMIKRVENQWIKGFLETSLEGAALLVLGLTKRSDVLDLTRVTRRLRGGQSIPLLSGADINEIFDQLGGGMLIIGEPGAGKTTLLLQLADHLIAEAKQDSSAPIPVVFNLSSWSLRRKAIDEWMVDELLTRYTIPADVAKAWIVENALIPLLDGLDEVAINHRSDLVEEINAFYLDQGVPLVVCCRTHELESTSSKLILEDAVELRPPSDEQIDIYLSHIEKTGTPLNDVRANFNRDPTLYQLLQSPLMLHVIALAYHGLTQPSLMDQMTLKERQARLWDAYIDRMFIQRPILPDSFYSEDQARRWLYWLARMLKDQEQTEFQLDRLAPSWLPGPWPGRARLMAGLATGLTTGLVGCFAFGLTFGWNVGIGLGVAVGIVLGIDAGLSGIPRWRNFPLVEQTRWSWRRMLVGLLVGLLAGVVGGLLVSLAHGFYGGLGFALAGALGGGLIGGVTSTIKDERSVPNEGIRRSARHAIRFAITAGIAACLIGGLTSVQGIGLITGIGIGIAGAMTGGLAIGLAVNTHTGVAAVISHYAVRASLTRLGRAPWRYVTFLDAITERLLLRQSGSAYLFVHRLLRDHIADSLAYAVTAGAGLISDSGHVRAVTPTDPTCSPPD